MQQIWSTGNWLLYWIGRLFLPVAIWWRLSSCQLNCNWDSKIIRSQSENYSSSSNDHTNPPNCVWLLNWDKWYVFSGPISNNMSSSWCLFLTTSLVTHHSYIGVLIKKSDHISKGHGQTFIENAHNLLAKTPTCGLEVWSFSLV